MTGLVVAATYLDRAEALIARSVLESEGIAAFMPDLHFLSVEPGAEFMVGGFRLLVVEDEMEAARAILRDAQLGSSEAPFIAAENARRSRTDD